MKNELYELIEKDKKCEFKVQYNTDKSNQWTISEKLTRRKILDLYNEKDIRFIEVTTSHIRLRISP